MRYQYLSFTVSEHIAHVRLNRPPVNALNRELVAELTALARDFVHSTDVWVVELSAEGKTFCAGADLKERATIPEADVATVVRNIQGMAVAWMQVPQPVVVGIQGPALGGGLAADSNEWSPERCSAPEPVPYREWREKKMIGQTIPHYPDEKRRDAKMRRKILEKSRPKHRSGRGCSFRSPSGTALGGGDLEASSRVGSVGFRCVRRRQH